MAGVVDSATQMVRNKTAASEEQKAGGPNAARAKAASEGSTSGGGGTVGRRPFGGRSVTNAKAKQKKRTA